MQPCSKPDVQLACSTNQLVELEVPPDHGNSLDNAGIPLAKLLFFMKDASALLTLIEALLFERYVACPQLMGPASAAMHSSAQQAMYVCDSYSLASAKDLNLPWRRCFQ